MASFGKLTEYFSLRKSRTELRSERRGRRSGSCCCSVTECRYGVAAPPSRCGCRVGLVVLGVLLPRALSCHQGLGMSQELCKQRLGAAWSARASGCLVSCVSAQGTSEVSAVHLGCLPCDCLHVYLPASVSCFMLCLLTQSLVTVAGLCTSVVLPSLRPSPCCIQNPQLQSQQQVAPWVEMEACVPRALPKPLPCAGWGAMLGAHTPWCMGTPHHCCGCLWGRAIAWAGTQPLTLLSLCVSPGRAEPVPGGADMEKQH